MLKAFFLVLLLGSFVLLGIGATQMLGSDLSRYFSGLSSDKAGWMVAGGIVAFLVGLFGLLRGSGRWAARTKVSPQGGVVPKDEEFSITVPASSTLKQGADKTVTVSLNRGAYFKRDVLLEIVSQGICVSPSNVRVKAGDSRDVHLKISAPTDAALGDYRVSVTGTPESGEPTSTNSLVTVVGR